MITIISAASTFIVLALSRTPYAWDAILTCHMDEEMDVAIQKDACS